MSEALQIPVLGETLPAAPAPAKPAAAPAAPKPTASTGVVSTAPVEAPIETPPETPPPAPVETPEQIEQREKRRGQARLDRKIDKAYRERAEANARADLLQKHIDEMNKPKAPVDENEPKIESFNDIEAYAQAKAEYKTNQARKADAAKQQAETYKTYQENLLTAWETKADKAEEKYEDFHAVVGNLDPRVPFIAALMGEDNGTDIAHYLAKHEAEVKRIAVLHPWQQSREIGKLSAKLAAEPAKPATPSKAPPPITPVGGATVSGDKKLSEMSYDEFAKSRKKFIAERR